MLFRSYHVTLFSYIVGRLKATKDGEGTLLDSTTYMLGSGMGNPNIHDHTNLPVVLAGGGLGGQHLRYADPVPLANVHLSLLKRMGVQQDKFGDSTGVISQI